MQRAMGLITREGEELSDISKALLAALLNVASQQYNLTAGAQKLREFTFETNTSPTEQTSIDT
jgi:hypothetical protein